MAMTKDISDGQVRIQGKISSELRGRAKAAAALRGVTLEEWIEQAIVDALARESSERIIPMRQGKE